MHLNIRGDYLGAVVFASLGIAVGLFVTVIQLSLIIIGLLFVYVLVDKLLKASSREVFLSLALCTVIPTVFSVITIFLRFAFRKIAVL